MACRLIGNYPAKEHHHYFTPTFLCRANFRSCAKIFISGRHVHLWLQRIQGTWVRSDMCCVLSSRLSSVDSPVQTLQCNCPELYQGCHLEKSHKAPRVRIQVITQSYCTDLDETICIYWHKCKKYIAINGQKVACLQIYSAPQHKELVSELKRAPVGDNKCEGNTEIIRLPPLGRFQTWVLLVFEGGR